MATLYFNAAVDSDWSTLGNWWQDAQLNVTTGIAHQGNPFSVNFVRRSGINGSSVLGVI